MNLTYGSHVEQWETLTHQSPLSALSKKDLSATQVVVVGSVAFGLATALSIRLTGDLGFFVGLCFVLVSVTGAMAASIHSLFAPGVLPPLLMIATVVVVANVSPDAIDVAGLSASAGTLQRAIAGLVDQAVALVIGHLLALAVIGLRIASTPGRTTGRS